MWYFEKNLYLMEESVDFIYDYINVIENNIQKLESDLQEQFEQGDVRENYTVQLLQTQIATQESKISSLINAVTSTKTINRTFYTEDQVYGSVIEVESKLVDLEVGDYNMEIDNLFADTASNIKEQEKAKYTEQFKHSYNKLNEKYQTGETFTSWFIFCSPLDRMHFEHLLENPKYKDKINIQFIDIDEKKHNLTYLNSFLHIYNEFCLTYQTQNQLTKIHNPYSFFEELRNIKQKQNT